MINANQFVGMVCMILGLVIIVSSACDSEFLFQLTLPRMLKQSLGRSAARWMLMGLGLGFVGLGVGVATDWIRRPLATPQQRLPRAVAASGIGSGSDNVRCLSDNDALPSVLGVSPLVVRWDV